MRAFVFWIWSSLSSLCEALGAPSRVAVGVGLFLLAGVVIAVTVPATAMVMTHTRDRIMVRQQARRWMNRKPSRAEWSLIVRRHGIHTVSPVMRAVALLVPVVIAGAFASDSTGAYESDWSDASSQTAFTDLVLFADRSPTDTGFLVVFGGLGIASVLLAYAAARITTTWRLARPTLSGAPALYGLSCGVVLLIALVYANPLVLAYAAACLAWVIVVAMAVALGKAPKTFVASLLDTSERATPQTREPEAAPPPTRAEPIAEPTPPPAPAPPPSQEPTTGTRPFSEPAEPAVDPTGSTTVLPATPALRCDPPRPGDPAAIGAYHILGRLGSGAMGTVYLAASREHRQVALKVLAPSLAHDDDSRRRFFREMHALQRIDNPRVVGVLDSGVVDEIPYIAMRAIEGPDLASHIRTNRPLDAAGLSTLALGLAEALAAVHEQGLVHRDVKPSNIIWSDDGPCLVDFGLAHLGDQTRVTSTGLVIGSPSYVSPERLRGTTATPASDVWNWAACLCFAAAGVNLYRSDDPTALWQRILNQDYDRSALDRLRILGAGVYVLAEQCLETEPAQRPRDGMELLSAYRWAVS